MGIVRSMFPNITVPEPTNFFFPRWHSNPLFRGSYSNWPPSFFSQHLDNLRANVGRLYFAGEATSRKYFGAYIYTCVRYFCKKKLPLIDNGDGWLGFLQGAYFEGLDIGQIIADCVKSAGSSCADLEHFVQVTNAYPYETSWWVVAIYFTSLTLSLKICRSSKVILYAAFEEKTKRG